MRAEYDSEADALSIVLDQTTPADSGGDEVHERAIVALCGDRPIEVQILYPELGLDEPLDAVATRYALDYQALDAAARSALAAPDRVVVLDVLSPA